MPPPHSFQKLKITFIVCNPDLSGGDRVIADHGSYLKKAGHHVTIIGIDTQDRSLKAIARSLIRHRQMPASPINTTHFDQAGLDVTILKNKNGPTPQSIPDADILIATWWQTAEWIKDFPTRKGKKVYFLQGYEAGLPQLNAQDVQATYHYPFHQVAVSQWLCQKINTHTKDKTCQLVENGVDTDFFSTIPRKKSEKPKIGFVFSNASVKNASLAIETTKYLKKQFPQLKAVSFGSQPPKEEYSLTDNIEFHLRPSQETIRSLYSSCDAWLFSSNEEGFGLPILEAMACGTPVIATHAGASPQIINHKNGFLCNERTPEALVSYAVKALTLPSTEWKAMSREARLTAEHYSKQKSGHKFEAALMEIYSREGIS